MNLLKVVKLTHGLIANGVFPMYHIAPLTTH